MKIRMLATILVLLSACTMVIPIARGGSIYTYHGNELSEIINGTTVPGINFTMTLAAPLSAGSTIKAGDLLDWSLTAFPYPTFNPSNAAPPGYSLELEISSLLGGLPDSWQIDLLDLLASPDPLPIVIIGQFDWILDVSNGALYLNEAPGTWSTVPESNTFVLIGLGLIPMLLFKSKKSGMSQGTK
jgi:hypothetical protein